MKSSFPIPVVHRHSNGKWGIFLLLFLTLLLPAHADEKTAKAPLPNFSDIIEVHLVPIHVLVRDRKGRPITGLTRNDFTILEDGKEQKITHFAEIRNRESVKILDTTPEKNTTAPVKAIIPPTKELIQERYIFYIDNLNIHPLRRNKVLNNLEAFVKKRISKGIYGMVVTYDRAIHFQTSLTDDPGVIIQAIEKQKERTGEALVRLDARRDLVDELKDAKYFSQALGLVRNYAATIYNEMQFTLDALQDFITGIKGLEGRKILIYVSSGLPETPGYEVFYLLSKKFPTENPFSYADNYSLRSRYTSIINTANSGDINLCMVDVSGLRALGSEGAAEERYMGTDLDETVETHNMIDPLKTLAEETGGVAIVNNNDFDRGFQRVAEIVDNYYFLGYQRSRPIQDRFHRIKVKLKKKIRGSTVVYKKSFLEKSIHSVMGDKIIGNLLFPSNENPMGVQIKFSRPTIKDREEGTYVMPVQIQIPFQSITLLPQDGKRIGRIRIGFAASDGRDRSDIAWKNHDFNIPEAAWEKIKDKTFTYQISMIIRGGASKVSVGVLSELDAMESYKTERVVIKPPQ